MDEIVARSLAKWPNVPAVYGWLELDRRGNWRIKGERITNPAFNDFIARNYDRDERGCSQKSVSTVPKAELLFRHFEL